MVSPWHPPLPTGLKVHALRSTSRSMELESVGLGGAAAFREVRVQSVVVEFLLTHVEVLFSDTFTSAGLDPAGMSSPCPDVLLLPSVLGLQWEGRWAPGPTPLTRPPPQLLEDPSPAHPSPRPLLLISAPTPGIPTSWPGRGSSFTPYSFWGRVGPWVHLGGSGRSPDLTPPWPCPDSLPCPGPQSSQESARRRALGPEVTDQSHCPCWLLGAAFSSARSASPLLLTCLLPPIPA